MERDIVIFCTVYPLAVSFRQIRCNSEANMSDEYDLEIQHCSGSYIIGNEGAVAVRYQ